MLEQDLSQDQQQYYYPAYTKYTSQYKNKIAMHKLHHDSGYQQQLITQKIAPSSMNYLEMNKMHLRNIFVDRLAKKENFIFKANQTINPTRLFEIQRQQNILKGKNKNKISFKDNIDTISCENIHNKIKIKELFIKKEKFKQFINFQNGNQSDKTLFYDNEHFRRGTQSFRLKQSSILKKEAYQRVFGRNISSISRAQILHKKTNKINNQHKRKNSEDIIHNLTEKVSSVTLNSQRLTQYSSDIINWVKEIDNLRNKTIQVLQNKQYHSKQLKNIDSHRNNRLKSRMISHKQISPVKTERLNLSIYQDKKASGLKSSSITSNNAKRNFLQFSKNLRYIVYMAKLFGVKNNHIINAFTHKYINYANNKYINNFFKEIRQGNTQSVELIISKTPKLVYQSDSNYKTPLIQAVRYNHYFIVEIILNQGVNIQQCSQNKNALYYALQNKNIQIIRLLLQYGQNPWYIDQKHIDTIQQSPRLKNLFKNARKIRLAIQLLPVNQKIKFWEQFKDKINDYQIINFL